MYISLNNVGKRFNREWIFRHFTYQFTLGNSYAIIGSNGSGKSTLLQVLAGATMQSEGKIEWQLYNTIQNDQNKNAYQQISIAAPYLDLIEELTASEFLHFHNSFKPLTLPVPDVLHIVGLYAAAQKQIRYFSSGMKQRLKLAQAFFSDTKILLLDEPTTNLDTEGIALYNLLLEQYCKNKLVVISSNELNEYKTCKEIINLIHYK